MTETGDEHGSPLRELMADATGTGYVSYASLAEAQAVSDGCVVLEGDDGGQLYVVAPARGVRCDEPTLQLLLRDLDAICWPGNYEDMARVVYERRPVGSAVAGGMGGGVVTAGGWVHPSLAALGVDLEVREVLSGVRDRLPAATRALRRG